jgi:hypothetical protein
MSKREIISHCFRIWCFLHSVPCDQTDIYSRGGHWYGQTRKVEANGYDTTLLEEYLIICKEDKENKTISIDAKLIKTYPS